MPAGRDPEGVGELDAQRMPASSCSGDGVRTSKEWTTRSVESSCNVRPISARATNAAPDAKPSQVIVEPAKTRLATIVHAPSSRDASGAGGGAPAGMRAVSSTDGSDQVEVTHIRGGAGYHTVQVVGGDRHRPTGSR